MKENIQCPILTNTAVCSVSFVFYFLKFKFPCLVILLTPKYPFNNACSAVCWPHISSVSVNLKRLNLYLKYSPSGCRLTAWQVSCRSCHLFFKFSTLALAFHYFLASAITERSAVIHTFLSSIRCFHFVFKIFPLWSVRLNMTFLRVLILLQGDGASYSYEIIFFIKFSDLILSLVTWLIFLLNYLSSFLWNTHKTYLIILSITYR